MDDLVSLFGQYVVGHMQSICGRCAVGINVVGTVQLYVVSKEGDVVKLLCNCMPARVIEQGVLFSSSHTQPQPPNTLTGGACAKYAPEVAMAINCIRSQ